MSKAKSEAQLKKMYKNMGFSNVHTLSEFVNIPAELEKKRIEELQRLGLLQRPVMTRKNNKKNEKRQIKPYEKRSLEQEIRAALNINNNAIPPEFQNLNGRSRSTTATSDPRSTSPTSRGGRRTRKQKRKGRKHTRKH